MRPNRALQGLILTIIIPFLIAGLCVILQHYNVWAPKVVSSGHIYSPAIAYNPDWALHPKSHWTLLVVIQDSNETSLKKWQTLPEFFPSSPLVIKPLFINSVDSNTFRDLQYPLDFSLEEPGTLLLLDSRGFIAMSFASTVVVQDVLKDLKKILPKHPIRRS